MCGSVCWYAHMSAGACGGQSIRFLRSWSLGGCEMSCVDVDIEFGSSVRAVYSLTMVISPQALIRKKKSSFISCCRVAAFFIRSAVPYCKRPSPRWLVVDLISRDWGWGESLYPCLKFQPLFPSVCIQFWCNCMRDLDRGSGKISRKGLYLHEYGWVITLTFWVKTF